jgi:CheY-like chemotaxis protein
VESQDKERAPVKILVVDDNSLQQKLMTVILRKLGFNPDVAQNGKEAVLALERESYDIIFMDICMPVMNGWQATKEIKRKRPDKAPFIIAASSNTEPDDKKRCLEAGMDSFIPKPIQFEQVRAVLQHAQQVKAKHVSPTNSPNP